MLICLFIDEIDSEGRIFNFGKSPNSFSVCGMEGYICLMVLMALVFGVPLIILSNRVSTLDFRIRSLEGLIANLSPAPQTAEAPERAKRDDMPPVISKPTPPLAKPELEPPLATESAPVDSVEPMEKSEPASDPIPVLPDMADQPDVSDLPEPVAAHTAVTPADAEPSVIEPATAQTTEPLESQEPEAAKDSFELEVGKVWFVRVGVVLVLTGLVFLAKMGYKNISDHIRPYLNASLLYLISFGMMGAGLFLRERFAVLKNYSEVLTGGGMAAVYFSTYALYFVKAPVLGLIGSPTLAGVLLAAWAIFIIWFATRKESEVMAMFAVAGAYYASYVPLIHAPSETNIWFTFASNMALAITATVFMVRNRWANLSFLALITTYAGFIFWRFQTAVQGEGEFAQDALFLGLYWLVFTAAGFLSRHDQMTPTKRSTFVNLNNGACFALLSIVLLQVDQLRDSYWVLPTVFGALLLVLFQLAKKWLPKEKLFADLLLAKSTVLMTLGVMTLNLVEDFRGLLLAAEALILTYFGLRTKNRLLQYGAMGAAVVGGLFVGFEVLATSGKFATTPLMLGLFFALLILIAAVMAYRLREHSKVEGPQESMANFFAAFGLLAVGFTLMAVTHEKYTELTVGILFVFALAQIFTAKRWPLESVKVLGEAYLAGSILLGLILALKNINPIDQLWALPLIGVALSVLFLKLRLITGEIAAQLFILTAALLAPIRMFDAEHDLALLTLVPFLTMLGMSHFFLHTHQMLKRENGNTNKQLLASIGTQIYFYAGWALSLIWAFKYVPSEYLFLTYTIVALGHSLAHRRRERLERLIVSGVSMACGLIYFWGLMLNPETGPNLMDLVPLLLLLGAQLTVRKQQGDQMGETTAFANNAAVILINTSLWVWASLMVSGDWDVITWSLLAFVLIGLGIWLKERAHRLYGLVILAVSSGYLVLIAFNHLEGAARILTLIGMGVILILLGLAYTKNQEKLRKIL